MLMLRRQTAPLPDHPQEVGLLLGPDPVARVPSSLHADWLEAGWKARVTWDRREPPFGPRALQGQWRRGWDLAGAYLRRQRGK